MGNPRQKKKLRSSTPRVTQKPKSQKHILSNPIIAANWDKTQTLSQNYKRLGLATKLNKHTGGVERKGGDIDLTVYEGGSDDEGRKRKRSGVDSLHVLQGPSKRRERLDVGEVRVERDPETGAILRVVEAGEQRRPNPLNDPLNEVEGLDDEDAEEGEGTSWVQLARQQQEGKQHDLDLPAPGEGEDGEEGKTDVVRQLEARASRPKARYQRKQTENEVSFIEELVKKHGEDYGKMARDMKINYMQRSEGDLKKRIKIWKERGGSIA